MMARKQLLLQILISVLSVTLILIIFYSAPFGSIEETLETQHNSHLFNIDFLKPKDRYKVSCFEDNLEPQIENMMDNLNHWSKSSDLKCKSLYDKFKSMYQVELRESSQTFQPQLAGKIKGWLGNSNKLYEQMKKQVVIVIKDVYNHHSTVYNTLRSKRPVTRSQKSSKLYVSEIVNASKPLCDFCQPLNMTAEDSFGRIRGKYSISAANAFKLDKWHGLFLTDEHSILDIKEVQFLDLFNTSLKWFKKVQSVDAEARYPVLFWDMFPHAGASQVHVHVHGLAGISHYPGQFDEILQVVSSYGAREKDHYWNNLIEVYQALGLALRFGNAIALASLVPCREHELWLICNEPSVELFQLLYYTIRMYEDELHRFCYSMGAGLPVLGQRQMAPEKSLPAIIRIGSRGDCASTVNDVSSLDLYMFNNVNVDPYNTIAKLRRYVGLLSSESKIQQEKMFDMWDNL